MKEVELCTSSFDPFSQSHVVSHVCFYNLESILYKTTLFVMGTFSSLAQCSRVTTLGSNLSKAKGSVEQNHLENYSAFQL